MTITYYNLASVFTELFDAVQFTLFTSDYGTFIIFTCLFNARFTSHRGAFFTFDRCACRTNNWNAILLFDFVIIRL